MLRLAVRPVARRITTAPSPTAARALSSRAVSRGRGAAGAAGSNASTQAVAARPSTMVGGGLSRLFDDFGMGVPDLFADPFFRPMLARTGGVGGGLMADLQEAGMGLDISESDTHYHVKAELPGVDKKDVRVAFKDGILTVEAEKKKEEVKDDRKHHYSDFAYGKLTRSLRVPDAADPGSIEAHLENGVLSIEIKKAEHAAKEQVIDVK